MLRCMERAGYQKTSVFSGETWWHVHDLALVILIFLILYFLFHSFLPFPTCCPLDCLCRTPCFRHDKRQNGKAPRSSCSFAFPFLLALDLMLEPCSQLSFALAVPAYCPWIRGVDRGLNSAWRPGNGIIHDSNIKIEGKKLLGSSPLIPPLVFALFLHLGSLSQ